MEIRKSNINDLEKILSLLKEGRDFLKVNNVDQWQDDYPNKEIAISDIENEESYVGVFNNEIIATVVLSFEPEEDYNIIYKGNWLSNEKYGVIHRLSVSGNYKGFGFGKKLFEFCEKTALNSSIKSIRVDTHKDNIPMQRILKSSGYVYCGNIFLITGDERTAFEKLICNPL